MRINSASSTTVPKSCRCYSGLTAISAVLFSDDFSFLRKAVNLDASKEGCLERICPFPVINLAAVIYTKETLPGMDDHLTEPNRLPFSSMRVLTSLYLDVDNACR